MYFSCRHRDECTARLKFRDGIPTLSQDHTHVEDFAEIQLLRFKTILRRRCREENTPFDTIFREEERRYPEAALLIGGLPSLRSTMVRARRQGTPRNPESIVEYATIIQQQPWIQRYGVDLSPDENSFFRGHVVASDGSVSVIFVSETLLQFVRQVGYFEAHMDATFKIVPRAGRALQLFSVHTLHDNMTFPLLYALMERKTRSAYTSVLSYLSRIIGNTDIDNIMADYETALRTAAVSVFPGINLRGCWFHYTRAIYRKAQNLGLVRNNILQVTRPLVRVAMVLPLLPNNQIANGINIVEDMAMEQNINITPFVEYLRRQWLPLEISVHAGFHRTNNSVESLHRQLYRFVGRPHPNIWAFTERLQQFEHSRSVDFQRLQAGIMLPNRRARRYVILDQKIRRAEQRLEEDSNVRRFLQYLSYSVIGLYRILNRMPDEDEHEAANFHIVQPQHQAQRGPAQILQPGPALVADVQQVLGPDQEEEQPPQFVAAPAPPIEHIPVVQPELNQAQRGPAQIAVAQLQQPETALEVDVQQPLGSDQEEEAQPPQPVAPPCLICMTNNREYMLLDCRHGKFQTEHQ